MNDSRFDKESAAHLAETYGSRIVDVLRAVEKTPSGRERIHPRLPYLWGELSYMIDHEMTLALDDFLIRRAPLFSWENCCGMAACEDVADRMQERLGWTDGEKRAQIERYRFEVGLTERFRGEKVHGNQVCR